MDQRIGGSRTGSGQHWLEKSRGGGGGTSLVASGRGWSSSGRGACRKLDSERAGPALMGPRCHHTCTFGFGCNQRMSGGFKEKHLTTMWAHRHSRQRNTSTNMYFFISDNHGENEMDAFLVES